MSLKSSANGRQPSLGFCLRKSRRFTLSVRKSVIFLSRLTRECTGAMVVNFVRMSFSFLSFVLFQMTDRNLDESNQSLMFDEDINCICKANGALLRAIRIDR